VAEPVLTCTDPGLGWLFDYSLARLIWHPLTPVRRGETLDRGGCDVLECEGQLRRDVLV